MILISPRSARKFTGQIAEPFLNVRQEMHREKHTKPFTIANLGFLIDTKKIWLNPTYQREAVWTRSQKQLLLDSLLQDIDIPKLYFRSIDVDGYHYEVVDGQQRLRAISEFLRSEFPLSDDADKVEGLAVGGAKMKELHHLIQMKLQNTQLDVCVLQKGYSDDDIEEIFLRLQNGTPLNAAEKRRALPGNMRTVVEELASHSLFSVDFCGFTGKRFAYEDAVAKLLHLTIEGHITDIKHSTLKRTYEANKNLKLSDPAPSSLKSALNYLAKAFKGGPNPKLKKFSVISLGFLTIEMREKYGMTDHAKEFAAAYLAFEQRRLMNDDLDESLQDPRLSAYTSAARADRVQDLEFRHETLRRELVSALPDLERKDEERTFSEDQRQAIFLRDKGVCQECGALCKDTAFHADHVTPWSKGGRTRVANGQVLCPECNSKKGAR